MVGWRWWSGRIGRCGLLNVARRQLRLQTELRAMLGAPVGGPTAVSDERPVFPAQKLRAIHFARILFEAPPARRLDIA